MFPKVEQKVSALTIILMLFSAIMLFAGCSIDYGSSDTDSSGAPDFLFYDTTLTRVQDGNTRAIMQASVIEQYGEENCLYGKDLAFRLLNATGSLTTTGSCDLFSMNQKTQVYRFFNSVDITSYDQDMIISGSNLQWNNKTEQMSSDVSETVTITTGSVKDTEGTQTVIRGTGLLVDGVSRTFSFSGNITGNVITSETDSHGFKVERAGDFQ